MNDTVQEYRDALGRLKSGETIRVPKGTAISKKSVAEEAGKHRSSIVASRSQFSTLISEIDEARRCAKEKALVKIDHQSADDGLLPPQNAENSTPVPDWKDEEIARLTAQLEKSISHEISLAEQVAKLKADVRALTAANVSSLG